MANIKTFSIFAKNEFENMRIHVTISSTARPIDFNYQPLLTGCVHKWMGENNVFHGKLSLYSFSWLQGVKILKDGVQIIDGSSFTLSFYDTSLLKTVISGMLDDPSMFNGARVIDIRIVQAPQFSDKERFFLASPVLIKRHKEFNETHYTYTDKESDDFMMETLKSKANLAGVDTSGLKVYFDRTYHSPKTKIVSYKGIQNKVSICPIIIEGTPEIISFAWHVGVGNSTGVGFGALK